jgi:hypothetical protein
MQAGWPPCQPPSSRRLPVDLRLKGSHFMQDLHLGDVSLSDLSDDQLKGLHYLVPSANKEDVTSIRNALENRLKNKWLLRYTCAAAYKCSCPFTLEIRHESGSDAVSIWQTEQHAFHDVNSAAHLAQLRMHPNIEAMAVVMLDAGASPATGTPLRRWLISCGMLAPLCITSPSFSDNASS